MRFALVLLAITVMYGMYLRGCPWDEPDVVSDELRTKVEACQKSCKVVDRCGMYFSNEHDEVMSIDACTDLCIRQATTAWPKCTLQAYVEQKCESKKPYRVCAEHLPRLPVQGGKS